MTEEIEIVTREVELSEPQTDVVQAREQLILDMAGQGAGKTENIGIITGWMISEFPEIEGFIAANTYGQLSQATLKKAFSSWKRYYGWEEYDAKKNPDGFYVVDKIPPLHFRAHGEKLKSYSNTISFKNGALILTGSLDNFKSHDGKEFGWAHLDETKDTKKEALTTVILARLRQRGLWVDQDDQVLYDGQVTNDEANSLGYTAWNPCWIHTSPSEGGVDWLLDMFDLKTKEETIRKTLSDPYQYFTFSDGYKRVIIYQTYWNEDNLPPNYIRNQKMRMSENEQMKFIDGYPFSKTGGEYFPNFYRRKHVRKLSIDPNVIFHLTYDFNVMPYITQLVFQVHYVVKWFNEETGEKSETPRQSRSMINVMVIKLVKEYCMKPPYNSTEAAADKFKQDVEADGLRPDVLVYGDASGRNRITGFANETQYKMIERRLFKLLSNGWLKTGFSNIGILKRRDLMNKILEGKIPTVEFYIDESAEETIRDMEFLKQDGTGGKYKEKAKDANGVSYEKIGHCSDAVEYFVCEVCKTYLKM